MIGANYQALLQGLDPDLLRDVAKLYALEAAEDALRCEAERAEIGRFNQAHPVPLREGLGALRHRLHATDYWAQQIIHRAEGDPDLWRWFAKTPEGAYARVGAAPAPRIVVPGWRGGLWSTVAAGVHA